MKMNGKTIGDEALDDYACEIIDGLFRKVAEDFGIGHGDVDPMQAVEIDRFRDVVKEYVRQNSE